MTVLVLRSGGSEVRLLPAAGGRVTACSLTASDGTPYQLLRPFPEDHLDLNDWAKGGIYPLIPYNGRIRSALLRHAGMEWRLTPHAGSPHTLHGIAQRRPWKALQQGATQALLGYDHSADLHWPWAFEARMRVTLEDRRVSFGLNLRNTGTTDMPGGVGLHPYFMHRPETCVSFMGGASWPFNDDYLASEPATDGERLRSWTIGAKAFEAGEVTHFIPNWAGQMSIDQGQGVRIQMSATGVLSQLVIHRPAAAPHVCIEPVSHVPDGFNLSARGVDGTGTRILAPGQAIDGQLELSVERSPSASDRADPF